MLYIVALLTNLIRIKHGQHRAICVNNVLFTIYLFIYQELTAILSGKKKGGCARGWCVRRGSLLQDRLPVKYPKCKHENFVRIDMKHSYFSNYFIICLPSIFSSVVEIIIELFVVYFMFILIVI